jgi:polar amino acid transport system permease protein
MLKTTLMSIIGVSELFRVAGGHRPFVTQAFFGVALYLALTTIWSLIQSRIERRLGVSTAGEAQPGLFARLLGMGRGRQGEGAP